MTLVSTQTTALPLTEAGRRFPTDFPLGVGDVVVPDRGCPPPTTGAARASGIGIALSLGPSSTTPRRRRLRSLPPLRRGHRLDGASQPHSYRFSIAWLPILPEGRGQVDGRGLDFYDRLVDSPWPLGSNPCRPSTTGIFRRSWRTKAAGRSGDRRGVRRLRRNCRRPAPGDRSLTGRPERAVRRCQSRLPSPPNMLPVVGRSATPGHEPSPPRRPRPGHGANPASGAGRSGRDRVELHPGDPDRHIAGRSRPTTARQRHRESVVRRPHQEGAFIPRTPSAAPPGPRKSSTATWTLIARPIDTLGVNFYSRKMVGGLDGEREGRGAETAMGWEVHPSALGELAAWPARPAPLPSISHHRERRGNARATEVVDGRVIDDDRLEVLRRPPWAGAPSHGGRGTCRGYLPGRCSTTSNGRKDTDRISASWLST